MYIVYNTLYYIHVQCTIHVLYTMYNYVHVYSVQYMYYMYIQCKYNVHVHSIQYIFLNREYGEQWHSDGCFEKRQNAYDDFQAAAEHLIEERVTCSNK